mgnify:CR=1 FL=1
MDIEVLGETFAEPIKKTDRHNYHTRVSIIDVATGQPIIKDGAPLHYYFVPEFTEAQLKDTVKEIKHTDKYLP